MSTKGLRVEESDLGGGGALLTEPASDLGLKCNGDRWVWSGRVEESWFVGVVWVSG